MCRDRAGTAGTYRDVSDAHHRKDLVDGAGDEGLVGLGQLVFAGGQRSSIVKPFSRASARTTLRVTPSSTLPAGAVMIFPSLQRKKLFVIASVISPAGI